MFIATSDTSFGDNKTDRTSLEAGLLQTFRGCHWLSYEETSYRQSFEHRIWAFSFVASMCMALDICADFSRTQHLILNKFQQCVWCGNQQIFRLMLKRSPKIVTKHKYVNIDRHWLNRECRSMAINLELIGIWQLLGDDSTRCLSTKTHHNFFFATAKYGKS